MTARIEFSQSVKRAAYDRSGGICECGCGQPFSDHPKERPEYDHQIPAYLGGEATLENCKALRRSCHRAKTTEGDTPRIVKARRGEKERLNLRPNKKRKLPGSKGSGMRKSLSGDVRFIKE